MSDANPSPFTDFAIQTDKPKQAQPKPAPKYQSLTFLSLVIQGICILLSGALLLGAAMRPTLEPQVAEATRLQALLQAPPPGTDRAELVRAHARLKEVAMSLKQTGETLLITGAVIVAFSGILGLALTGWVYKATSNLPALAVPQPKYSPLISAFGMLLIPVFVSLPILNELIKGSDPDRLTPYGHRSEGTSGLAVAWWLCLLVGQGTGLYVLWSLLADNAADGAGPSNTWLFIASGGGILQYLLTICLVSSVWSNQSKRLEIAQNPPSRPAVAVTPEFTNS